MSITFWNSTVQFIKPSSTIVINYNRLYSAQRYILSLQLVPSELRYTKGTRRLNFSLNLKESIQLGFLGRFPDQMQIVREKLQFRAKSEKQGVRIGISDNVEGLAMLRYEVVLQRDQMQLVREVVNRSLPAFAFQRPAEQLLACEEEQPTEVK